MGGPPIAISGENADIPFEKHRFVKTVPGYHPFFLIIAPIYQKMRHLLGAGPRERAGFVRVLETEQKADTGVKSVQRFPTPPRADTHARHRGRSRPRARPLA